MSAQPQISATYKLLAAGYDYDGLSLDLYGTVDSDGAEVCAVALTGSTVDLEAIAFSNIYQRAQDWLDVEGERRVARRRNAFIADRQPVAA